jgi:hypothetical protein
MEENVAPTDRDFLHRTQLRLAKENWELRGSCNEQTVDDALREPVSEILLVKQPGRTDEFYYFTRIVDL